MNRHVFRNWPVPFFETTVEEGHSHVFYPIHGTRTSIDSQHSHAVVVYGNGDVSISADGVPTHEHTPLPISKSDLDKA